ncbi:glycosyltransferase, partial [Micromonospora sp. M51]
MTVLLALLIAVAALTGHTWLNAARWLRRPTDRPDAVDEPVAVLLPLRDEATRVTPCLRALLAQRGVPGLRIVVLDDGSTDGTADVVRAVVGDDPRVTLLSGVAPPPGWLGKPHACWQLATRADPDATALVFVDADVVLAPHAVAAAVTELRAARVTLLSPYPRIVVATAADRLVQPLLQWLWLT